METSSKALWLEHAKNQFISLCLFAALFGLLYLHDIIAPSNPLLRFGDLAFVVGIPASIIGVGYTLTIRNSGNYTGFFGGIAMALLLAWQTWLLGSYDMAFLYIAIFIPFNVRSIMQWKSTSTEQSDEPFRPSFLNSRQRMATILTFAALCAIDYLVITYLLRGDSLSHDITFKLLSGMMLASCFFGNFWLIYRKTDAWFFWLIYSATGIVFFAIMQNVFNIVLFTFFLVINATATRAWLRS